MKFILTIITIVLATGCHRPSTGLVIPAHSKKVVVKLMDSLGTFSMYIPERYDTSFTWIHQTDYSDGDLVKSRMQSKMLPVNMEDGYIWKEPTDSVDCLTIIYSPYFRTRPVDSIWISNVSKYFKEKMKAQGTQEDVILDTTYKIYDRPFAVNAQFRYIPQIHRYFYEMSAISSTRMAGITFKFKMITDKKDSISENFIKNNMALLQTVRFDKAPW